MKERIHTSKPIKVSHIGKNYYELKVSEERILLERSEIRELIQMLDNTVSYGTPDVTEYLDESVSQTEGQ